MDRYIVREQRSASAYPGPGRTDNSVSYAELPQASMIPEAVYYKEQRYGSEYPTMQQNTDMNHGYMRMLHPTHPPYAQGMNVQTAGMNVSTLPSLQQGHGQYVSGIDRNYLAAYSPNNAAYMPPPATNATGSLPLVSAPVQNQDRIMKRNQTEAVQGHSFLNSKTQDQKANESLKNIEVPVVPTRAEKMKALYKSGSRAFSGPVEKVIKWHKAIQDIGLLVIYEIVAKCLNIRSGESSAKHLVIRDDNGPAMQVVYYEIDFLLPEIKPPCTVRVVGRMMAGTSRFQAFNIRPATGDDVAIQPRRAAVANHHVANLCKEYGVQLQH